MMKKLILIKTIFLLIIAALSGCDTEEETGDEQQDTRLVAVETIVMERDRFDDYIRLTGTVEAFDDATISAETQGQIQSIAARGTRVNEGEIIAQIDNRMIQSQYNSARTAFQFALDNFNRLESLHADSIISTQDFQSARTQRDQAEAQLEQAEKQLQDSNIEAPFTGRIEERFIQKGELVSPGMPVARLVNSEKVRVLAGMPERFSGDIREGTTVELRLMGVANDTIQSTISYAGNVIDPDTRTFTVEIELPNMNRLLKPEMVVDLRVKRQELEGALIIPRTSVLRSEEGVNVFKSVQENGEKYAQLVTVETGQASGPLIEIVSGLNEGDEIVITGLSNLNEGDRLNILNTETSVERGDKLSRAERPFVSY